MIEVDVLHSVSAVGTQILLTHGKEHVIVDVGDGTVRDLVSKSVDFKRILGVLLTHEHFDHFSGLYGLLHFFRLQRRQAPLILVVPKPARVVNFLMTHPIMYESLPFEVRLVELTANESAVVGELDVRAFAVEHGRANAFGYSIKDKQGFRIVVSGDTVSCENLERNIEGADIAILDATYADDRGDLAVETWAYDKISGSRIGEKSEENNTYPLKPRALFQDVPVFDQVVPSGFKCYN